MATALGIMFHHFIDDKHPYIQGALTACEFEDALVRIGPKRFLPPDVWIAHSQAGALTPDDLCLTLDDALLSQVDVALPVLDRYGLKAFFFIYSAIFNGYIELFEMIRYFRNVEFASNHDFYDAFYAALRTTPDWARVEPALHSPAAAAHLSAHGFYSRQDRIFRFVRDTLLDRDAYYGICEAMMAARNFDQKAIARKLWLDNDALVRLDSQGHMIGLHSNTHPTNLGTWTAARQRQEYGINHAHLTALLGKPPRSVAYPSGNYDGATLALMREFNIEVGFRSDEASRPGSLLEQPRLDYSLYLQRFSARSQNGHESSLASA